MLDKLCKVHISAEVFFHGLDVAFEAVSGELRPMLFGNPLAQVADELVRAETVALPDVVAQDRFRLSGRVVVTVTLSMMLPAVAADGAGSV